MAKTNNRPLISLLVLLAVAGVVYVTQSQSVYAAACVSAPTASSGLKVNQI